MKKKWKGFCLLFIAVVSVLIAGAQIVSVSGARTPVPGLYASLGYSHPSFSAVNLGARAFIESAILNRINYRCFGVDVVGEYLSAPDPAANKFGIKTALGATGQIESEPFIYKGWPLKQRINYGLLCELSGLWHMTEAFALSLFGQQKFLFNKLLGTTHFLIGLSISYRLGL